MTNKTQIFFLLVVLFKFCDNIKIPPYFSQCSKSDPNVNECITHNANGGLHAFIKGDKSYNIQSMLPILIPYFSLRLDKQLKLNVTNSVISEFGEPKIKDAKLQLEEKQIQLALYMPRTTLMGQYHLKGKISILPIDERGPVNITVLHSRIKYNFGYELVERKGFYYINITSSTMNYKSERAFFQFYNLFAEHEFLGNVINNSLNENWYDTNEALAPAISNALCEITTRSLKGFFDKVPYEEILGE